MIARIARELGKFMWEVEQQLPIEEFDMWVNLFKIENHEAKNRKSKPPPKTR